MSSRHSPWNDDAVEVEVRLSDGFDGRDALFDAGFLEAAALFFGDSFVAGEDDLLLASAHPRDVVRVFGGVNSWAFPLHHAVAICV